MDGSTALAVLGLAPGATKQQVKTAFRALVKEVHPDASGAESADQARFHRLHAAYEQAMLDAPVTAPVPVRPRSNMSTKSAWITAPRVAGSATIDVTDVGVSAPVNRQPSRSVSAGAEAEFAALLDAELARA